MVCAQSSGRPAGARAEAPAGPAAGWQRAVRWLGILALLLVVGGCGDVAAGPEITAVSVDPATIEFNRYNGSMSVTISIAGFSGKVVEADAFIQLTPSPSRTASKDSFSQQGNTLRLEGVSRTWFQGLPPGTYQIGAAVVSESGESVEQLDLASVEVVD